MGYGPYEPRERNGAGYDRKTVYYGEDGGTHYVYKFVADVPGNLSAGKVYVLSLDQPLVNDDPSGTTARWVQLPNATQ